MAWILLLPVRSCKRASMVISTALMMIDIGLHQALASFVRMSVLSLERAPLYIGAHRRRASSVLKDMWVASHPCV